MIKQFGCCAGLISWLFGAQRAGIQVGEQFVFALPGAGQSCNGIPWAAEKKSLRLSLKIL